MKGKYLADAEELEKKYGSSAGFHYAHHSTAMLEKMKKHPVYKRILASGAVRAEELAFLVIELVEEVESLRKEIEKIKIQFEEIQ